MLINRPKKVIAQVAGYQIIVKSENDLEDADRFNRFCDEFKAALMVLASAPEKPKMATETLEKVQ